MRALLLIALLLLAACTDRQQNQPPITPQISRSAASGQASTQKIEEIEAARNVVARLIKRYAATYDYNALLAEPAVRNELQALLGPEYKRLTRTLSGLRFPIDVTNGGLSLVGRRKDGEIWDEAVLCIPSGTLRVEVGFFSQSQMILYTQQPEYRFVSSCIQQWVFMQTAETGGISLPPKQGGGEFTFEHKTISDRAPRQQRP